MNYDRSNSLTDLGERIRTEHDAASAALKDGLQHAITAGELLIEAKAQIKHGQWSQWLAEHCSISERTSQAYMRVARSLGNLESAKAQRVADLSFRDALQLLADTGSILKDLPPASYERALDAAENQTAAQTLRQEVRRVRLEDLRAQRSFEPQALLPPPHGRRILGAHNAETRQWLLAIGPDITLADLTERERLAREDERVQSLKQERDELNQRADALEAEAKALREDARSVKREINETVKDLVGPVKPFTETYDFQCEADADAELAALSDSERVERLLKARGAAHGPIKETKRGYWGDIRHMSYQHLPPGPGSWTHLGSPEWLDEVFPGWRKDTPA